MQYDYYLEQKYMESGIVKARILTASEARAHGYEDSDKITGEGYTTYIDGFDSLDSIRTHLDSLKNCELIENHNSQDMNMGKNRMSEIRGNLKNDVKDLLTESANLVTSFFKRGLCTVRVMAEKWKAFTHGISDAVDSLMKPSFVNGEDAPRLNLAPDAEPVVTVTESADRNFPVGKRMLLSEANELIRQADEQRHDAGKPSHTVKVKIDYMWGDTSDRYWLSMEIGSGKGDLLGQMEHYLNDCRADPAGLEKQLHFENVDEKYREDCRAFFLPFLHESVKDLSNNLLPYFRSHCEVAKVKQAAEALIPGMGEGRGEQFRQNLNNTISGLRRVVNERGLKTPPERTMTEQETPQRGQEPPQPEKDTPPAERPSVRTRLEQIKRQQGMQPQQHKPQRVTVHPKIK